MLNIKQQTHPMKRPLGGMRRNFLSGRFPVSVLCCILLVHAMIPTNITGQTDSRGEYELKAAMLYNLTRFVEWPSTAFPDPRTPITLCIIGRDPFGSSLSSTVLDKTVNGRPVLIRHPQNGKEFQGCHVLYIDSAERKRMPEFLSILSGSDVLTVGEMTQFAVQGGMVQFSMEDKRVGFEINVDMASKAGLKISAKLLTLARIVKA